MAKPSRARATPPGGGLPDEILFWEILVRLPPKYLLRCLAVCRAWRGATSTRGFLLAHHARQPILPIVCGSECGRQPILPIVCGSEYGGAYHKNFHSFDHRAAEGQLQSVFRLQGSCYLEASCDGLLILSNQGATGNIPRLAVCNPATRQHAPLWQLSDFDFLGMYAHRPTGEYRLLLLRRILIVTSEDQGNMHQSGCYVFALGSHQLPRYIGGPEAAAGLRFSTFAQVRDKMHWFPVHYHTASKVVIVFDTTSESFRQMRAPDVPYSSCSSIFEMDATLGIYSYDKAMQTVDIWVLQNYESEVWKWEYKVELPVAEIRERFQRLDDDWDASVVSVHGDVLLLVSHGEWLFYVDTDGNLVDNFHRDGQELYGYQLRHKQTLVQHTFFTALKGYDVNALPFV